MHIIRRSAPRFINLFKPILPQLSITNRIQYSFSNNNRGTDFEKLKEDSKTFYNNQVQKIHQLTEVSEWKSLVEESVQPVVIDFYADWAEQCKKLTSYLETEATKDNNWRLVKINIDKFPQVVQQLQIKAVPTILLISNKQFVDAFSGFPDEATLTRFMTNLKKGLDSQFLNDVKKQNQQMEKLEKIKQLLVGGQFLEGQTQILSLMKIGVPQSAQPITALMLAHAYVEQRKLQKYQAAIANFNTQYKHLVQSTEQVYAFIKQYLLDLNQIYQKQKAAPTENQNITKLKSNLTSNPTDLQSKFQLASQYIKLSLHEQALILLLQIVKANKNWQNKKANNLMLQVFKKLGTSDEITVKYRKLYQRLLY